MNSKMVSAICALTLRTSAFEQSVREPFLLVIISKFRENGTEVSQKWNLWSLKLKPKVIMREKATWRIINPARAFYSQIVYCFVSAEVNEAPKYNFQRLTDFYFSFALFFLITKHKICERLKTKRFPSVIPYQIYKVGPNNVLGLHLLWVHHRVDSLWYIAKTYKTPAGLGGGRRSFVGFASE